MLQFRRHCAVFPFLSFVAFSNLLITLASGSDFSLYLRQGCTSPHWKPDHCTDHPCFSYRRKEHRTCEWIAQHSIRKAIHCQSSRIQNYCPVSCEVAECTSSPTQNPTSKPTSNPTTKPTTNPTANPTSRPTSVPHVPRGKKGICLTLREAGRKGSYKENLPKIRALNPNWVYSWGPNPPTEVPQKKLPHGGIEILPNDNISPSQHGIDYVPMLWGYYPNKFEDVTDLMLNPHPKIVFGFNEPESRSQSNLSLEHALEGWERLVTKMEKRIGENTVLVSPSCVRPTREWCRSFMQQADERGLRVDAIGVHWYGGANAEAFISTLIETYEIYGNRPIVVTEFAIADWDAEKSEDNKFSPEQALGFMQVALPWLENTDWILGYAWFSFQSTDPAGWISALVDSVDETAGDVVLTTLGQYYSDYTETQHSTDNFIFT